MNDINGLSNIPRAMAMEAAKQVPALAILVCLVVYGVRAMSGLNESHVTATRQQAAVMQERFRERDAQLERFANIMDAAQSRMAAVVQENTKVMGENNRTLAEVARRLERLN